MSIAGMEHIIAIIAIMVIGKDGLRSIQSSDAGSGDIFIADNIEGIMNSNTSCASVAILIDAVVWPPLTIIAIATTAMMSAANVIRRK